MAVKARYARERCGLSWLGLAVRDRTGFMRSDMARQEICKGTIRTGRVWNGEAGSSPRIGRVMFDTERRGLAVSDGLGVARMVVVGLGLAVEAGIGMTLED